MQNGSLIKVILQFNHCIGTEPLETHREIIASFLTTIFELWIFGYHQKNTHVTLKYIFSNYYCEMFECKCYRVKKVCKFTYLHRRNFQINYSKKVEKLWLVKENLFPVYYNHKLEICLINLWVYVSQLVWQGNQQRKEGILRSASNPEYPNCW